MKLLTFIALLATASTLQAATLSWLEADSAAAIAHRRAADFNLSLDKAKEMIRADFPDMTDEQIQAMIDKKYLEADTIDGELRVFRKAVRNMKLLNPDMNGGVTSRGATASPRRIAYVDSVLDYYKGNNPDGLAHKVRYRFTIDVPYQPELKKDTLRVWMPVPHQSARQSDIRIISASQPDYILSDSTNSIHHTIYFERPVTEGEDTHFEYSAEFITRGQYFSPEYIRGHIQDYDKNSELYRKYTAVEHPHIIDMKSLAEEIVNGETDPYRCSELVYEYIINHYLWAGAREYSTIECIPEYVIDQRHGDCGQVALLYISLMRSLGIPARWESGWMIHPGEKNYHDWAEVYFEGVGWVPVDVSFGRYSNSPDPAVQHFYSTGMDSHRFATNLGVCGQLFPNKRFVRSETVDLQPGEVESTRGNLFYPAWNQHFQLIEITPVTFDGCSNVNP